VNRWRWRSIGLTAGLIAIAAGGAYSQDGQKPANDPPNPYKILDQDGKFIAEWKQFSRPSGVFIRNDVLYVADSESNGVAPHPGWKRGIRIGSVKDGKVIAFIPDPDEMMGTSAAVGIAVDGRGNVYGGEVGPQRVSRHSKP
jgi:hypothetical protein